MCGSLLGALITLLCGFVFAWGWQGTPVMIVIALITIPHGLARPPALADDVGALSDAAACVCGWLLMPETKGRTLEEIGASWGGSRR
jgi:hypothetical protein